MSLTVMPARQPAPADPTRLDELAAIANAQHEQANRAGQSMLDHAIAAGEALLEAQKHVERGSWIAWFRRNIRADLSTAYRYMRIAEHRKLVTAARAESIADAMRALADVPRRGHGPTRYTDADKRDWVKLADEIGVKPAARALGVSPSTMHRWTSPGSEARGKTFVARQVTTERIERMAEWLVERFGGFEYPERVTPEVRVDAAAALAAVFEVAA